MARKTATQCTTTPHLVKLSALQERVADSLAGGMTIKTAAEQVDIDRATVHRWLRNSFEFQAAMNQRRRAIADAHADALRSLRGEAIAVLREIIADETTDSELRVKAAVGILKACPLVDSIGPTEPQAMIEDEARRRQEAAERENELDLSAIGDIPTREELRRELREQSAAALTDEGVDELAD